MLDTATKNKVLNHSKFEEASGYYEAGALLEGCKSEVAKSIKYDCDSMCVELMNEIASDLECNFRDLLMLMAKNYLFEQPFYCEVYEWALSGMECCDEPEFSMFSAIADAIEVYQSKVNS